MIFASDQIRLSATDLSNHLACGHLTSLDLSVARAERSAPEWRSPDLRVIQELGLRHETAYLESLRSTGISFVDLREKKSDSLALAETRAYMERGVDAIAQGALAATRWFGRPDLLRKVEKPSNFGNWSYETYDCKLSRETKATTILQLALYSDLLSQLQGASPESMHVVLPGQPFQHETYRFAEYAAYYRYVRARLEKVCNESQHENTYPEPCDHCAICRWFRECDARRRGDDHLSLVAGIARLQRTQLIGWQTETMAKLAELPIPLKQKPLHGSREGYERVREQARVQVAGRSTLRSVHELLPVTEGTGFCKLPEPSQRDIFVDLEGDPFAGIAGLQYLFGFVSATTANEWAYEKRWALTPAEEKQAFEWLIDEIMHRWQEDPAMHVYHFGAYEPSAFKRLMGLHTTREDEIDRMLRAHLFVDLHTIFKQAARASVEEYSLKAIEKFYEFVRSIPPDESRAAMRFVEHSLELGRETEVPEKYRESLETYNGDDCRSTASLRDWLEAERQKLVANGTPIPRPPLGDGAPPEELDERQKRVAALVAELLGGIPADPKDRTAEQSAQWMLAQLLDWHRRESKASWWEGYRLAELDDEALMDERAGLSGLRFVQRLGIERKIPVDRYSFEKQETEVRVDKDVYLKGEKFGCVETMDLAARTIDIKKTKKTAEIHPAAVYAWDRPVDTSQHADALLRIGHWVADNKVEAEGPHRAARDLLLRKAPRLTGGMTIAPRLGENAKTKACRIATALDHSIFAIQGPPGAGKTYTGARMICQLVKQGKRIGITALSHKVIRKLLDEVCEAADEDKIEIGRCIQKVQHLEDQEETEEIAVADDNDAPLEALRSGAVRIAGGTSWLWTRPGYSEAVDVLFIDEAGQMSLADVIAVSQAAHNVVLIGDPRQLDRPLKGSHPPGAEKSALEHLLGDHKTIPDTMGLLLPETWRMHPKICEFTSELFYEGRLGARDFTRNRVLEGHPWLSGAGLWYVPVMHEGNRNSSPEEVEVVARIAKGLLGPGVNWFYGVGNKRPLALSDILIVAPYNAQVSDLLVRLPEANVGTVDKFQGQEAPVVIYSLTTSSPQDAPRGMEFLYSLNRLNVATSRAKSNVIVVGSPKLLEPECKTPRQMQLANALCRYLELATVVTPFDL
jgi:predicted RecB family nuclease